MLRDPPSDFFPNIQSKIPKLPYAAVMLSTSFATIKKDSNPSCLQRHFKVAVGCYCIFPQLLLSIYLIADKKSPAPSVYI